MPKFTSDAFKKAREKLEVMKLEKKIAPVIHNKQGVLEPMLPNENGEWESVNYAMEADTEYSIYEEANDLGLDEKEEAVLEKKMEDWAKLK